MRGPRTVPDIADDATRVNQVAVDTLREALAMADRGAAAGAAEVQRLAGLRAAFDELAEAYEALRRVVERGHVTYRAPPAAS